MSPTEQRWSLLIHRLTLSNCGHPCLQQSRFICAGPTGAPYRRCLSLGQPASRPHAARFPEVDNRRLRKLGAAQLPARPWERSDMMHRAPESNGGRVKSSRTETTRRAILQSAVSAAAARAATAHWKAKLGVYCRYSSPTSLSPDRRDSPACNWPRAVLSRRTRPTSSLQK
jgi:hypothetical protein